MKIKFIIFIIVLGISKCLACKCYEYTLDENIKIGIEKADLIFYGELTDLDTLNNKYTFKIVEFFKGNHQFKTITFAAKSNCDFYFNEKGLCIIYGNFNKDKTALYVSVCSPSQSMNFGPGFPPLPFKFDSKGRIISKNKIEMSLFNLENQNKSLQLFIYQLKKLRQYKQNQKTITENAKSDLFQKILIVSLISNVVLFLGLIIVINRKRV